VLLTQPLPCFANYVCFIFLHVCSSLYPLAQHVWSRFSNNRVFLSLIDLGWGGGGGEGVFYLH
jgi:hypothetical protein